MSAPDISSTILEPLVPSGGSPHITFLLGAGASTTSGLPGWDDFAKELLIRSEAVLDPEAASLLVQKQDPTLSVEAAKQKSGSQWKRNLRHALYANRPALTPSRLHRATVGHFLENDDEDTTLVTLNFDTLLEDALQQDSPLEVVSNLDGTSIEGCHSVYHLHGLIAPNGVRDVVLTLSEFNELSVDHGSWQAEFIRNALDRGSLIIAGTSFRDPDLRQWIHLAMKDSKGTKNAFVLLAREAFGLSREEFEQIREALTSQWEAVGIHPVILEDFSDAAQIIRELRQVSRPGYVPPQDRARLLWDALAEDFDRYQSEFAADLESDAAALRDALDVEALNVTLWVADGRGALVRWASQDRLHKDLNHLRRVPSGHGSAWVAGRALAGESILMQDLSQEPTQRWKSVIAVPIPVVHSTFPDVASGVLSIGLSEVATHFEPSQTVWLDQVLDSANMWSTRLSDILAAAGSN